MQEVAGSTPVGPTKIYVMITEMDVKKQLYKSKVNAKFSHYVSGNLYYTVQLEDGIYQFPISTVDGVSKDPDMFLIHGLPTYHLSADLGTTSFYNEMKGSELNRWIAKAIESGDFIKVG